MTRETGDGASGGSASVGAAGDGSFDALAAAVEEGAYRLDAEGRFEAVNEALLDLVDYEREALIGERFTTLVGEEDVEAVEAAIGELRRADDGQNGDGGRVVDVEVSIRTASGESIPSELRLAAVEADGRFAGTAGSLRVGDDRQQEAEVREREGDVLESELDEALDRVSDAFFVLDDEWRFTYLNDKAEALLGVDRESVSGHSVWEEFEEAVDSTFYEEYHEAMERQEPTTFVEFYPPLSTWFEVAAYPGETGLSVYFRDVTDRVQREQELEHYETLVQTVDDGLYAVDEDYRYTLVNDAYCELTGYDREELLGEHISMVVDSSTVEMATGLREDLLEDDEAGAVEVEIERADGERIAVESRYAAMPGDEFHGTVGVVRDISERKAFEETLAALHEASRELHVAETSDDVVDVILGTLTDVVDLPSATVFRRDEDAGMLVPEHQTSAAVDSGQELPPLPAGEGSLTGHVLETGEFHAFDDVRETSYLQDPKTEMRAGLIVPLDEEYVLVVSSPEPGAFDERTERLVEILAGNATAALDRQERERELRESERRYRTLVDNFPNGAVALYDEDCQYVTVGGQMYDRIDLSPEDAVGMTVGERLSGEIAEALESTIQRAFEGESEEVEVPYDGRDFRLQSLPIRDDEGDVNLAMVVTQDVTERKQAEDALEESERRFRTMMEQSPLSTQIFDPDGNALMVNPAWEELWQASSEDMGEYNVLEDEQLEAKGLLPYLEKGFEGEATQLPPVYYDPDEIGKEGRPRWIEAFVYPVVDEAGDIREVVLIHNDVTESRERERELEQYETIVETVDDGVYVLDEGQFVFVNEAFADMVGYDREELIGSDVSKVTTGEYRDEIEEEIRRLEEGEVSVGTIDTELLTAEGERVPVEAHFSHFPLEEGGHGRVGIVRDVSEREERERKLRESERRYRTLVDNFPDGSVGLFDSDLRYLIVGGEIYDEIDLSAADVVGMPIEDRLPGDLWEELEAPLRATFDGEHHQTEVEAQGRVFRVQTLPVHDEGNVIAGMIMSQDVTERKEYERELEQYQSVVETVEDGVYVVDSENRFILVNDAYCEIVGRDREELLGSTSATVIGDEAVAELEEMAEAVAEGDVDDAFLEIEFERPDGETVTLATRFGPYATRDGMGRVGVIRDVTERKERERELERYETAFDTASDVVVTIDKQSTIRDVNPAVADVFGYEPDELVGEPLTTLMPERFRRQHRDGLDRYLETGEVRLDWEYIELPGEHRDGHEIPLAISFGEFEYDGERFFTGIIRDVTERKRAERQLEEERDMFAEGPAVVMRWGIGEDWPVEYVSDNVEEVLGYTPAELESGDVRYKDLLLEEEADRITREIVENSDETTERFSHDPYRVKTRDGDVRWVKDVTKILRDESGDITGYLGYLVDITERKERERELAEQRERYRGLVESAPIAIGTYDADGRITYANDAAADLLGVDDPDDLVGKESIEFVHPDDRAGTGERMQRVIEDREILPPRETRLIGLDGEVRYAMVASAPITEDGEPAAQVVLSDVTDQKEYERRLAESEQRYRSLVEHFPNGAVALVDRSLRYHTVGGAPREIAGVTVEELEGAPVAEVLPQELADELVPEYEAALRGESTEIEIEFEGRVYQFQFVPVRDEEGDVFAALGMSQDITERRQREHALEESEQRYRTLVESYPGGAVAMFDSDLRYTAAGGQLLEAEGVDPEEHTGQSIFELYPDDLIEEIEPHFRAALEGETNSFEVQYRGRDLFNYTLPVGNADGEVFGGMLVVNDVTEQREYERELQQYESIVGAVEDGVYVLDDDGRFVLVNDAMVSMTDYEREELIGAHGSTVFGERFNEIDEQMSEAFRSGERDLADFEEEVYTADGETITVESRFTVFDFDGGQGRVGVVRDISERKEYERTLERFRTIIETVDDGVYVIDSEGYITMVNAAYAEMAGYHRDELIGMHASELVDEPVHEQARDIEAELESGEKSTARLAADLKTADDRSVTAEATFALLPGDDEDYERVAVVRDITERVEREAELERALDLLDRAEEIANVAGWEIDPETLDVFWTDQLFDLLRIPPGESPPLEEALDVYPEKDRAVVEDAIERGLAGEPFDIEVSFFTDEGERRWTRVWGVPEVDDDGEVVSLRGAFQDITGRIERERELQRALDLLHRTEGIADVGGWEIDPETQDVFWTEQLFGILGIPDGEVPPLEESMDAIYHPEDQPIIEGAIEAALEDGEPFDVEVRFVSRGGDDPRWARVQGVPEVEEGEVVSLRGAFHDVTERVEREAELERTLDLLERTENIADVGGWEIDPETQDVFWTEHTYELQGIPPGEAPPLEEALEVYHPEDRTVVEEAIEHALESGEPIDVEVRYTPVGSDEVRWFRLQGVPEVVDGEVVSLRGAAQDVTERIRRERELRGRVEQENAITQLGTLALEEPDLDRLFDRATDLVVETLDNDLCKLLELQPDGDSLALRAGRGWDDGLVGETTLGTEDDSIADRTLDTEEAIVVDDLQTEDPSHRPDLLDAHGGRSGVSVIVGSPQDPWGVLGTYDTERREFSQQDVNFVQSVANILAIAIERADREEELHTRVEQQQVVTDLGKQALEDIDIDRLFEEAVERVAETLDNEYAKVLELQPDRESLLLRSGVGWRDGLVGEGTVGTGEDSQAGHTIRSEEPIVVTDLATEERFSGPELLTSHGVVSGISTVIGPHDDPWGVLGTHDTERREFSQQDVNFVQSVANILATAIDRRTREREIENQRNRMAAIVRLSEIVQEVDQAVIEQSTREEIDRLVCNLLVESGEYGAAWVGDVNLASQTVAPRAVAGLPDELVDAVSFDVDGEIDGDGHVNATAAAAATGEARTARVGDDEEAFPAVARERGYRSVAAVPLAFEDVRYGVLTLFSERENAFEGYERAVLEQLGRTVGHAINAIDRKQALVGDSFTEIEIRLPGVIESLAIDDEGEHSIVVEGTVPASGDRIIQYLRVTGIEPETFLEIIEELPPVDEVREIGGDGPSQRYEVTYEDPPLTSTLASYGGRIDTVSFDVPDLRVTAALPPTADVRQIVQTLRSEYPDLRIDAQRTVTRDQTSTEEHRNAIEEALTERQRTALMTAFFAGYFEWSRESTGEEVAETLGVSPSTFHQHLRAAQRKVISALFEGEQSA